MKIVGIMSCEQSRAVDATINNYFSTILATSKAMLNLCGPFKNFTQAHARCYSQHWLQRQSILLSRLVSDSNPLGMGETQVPLVQGSMVSLHATRMQDMSRCGNAPV